MDAPSRIARRALLLQLPAFAVVPAARAQIVPMATLENRLRGRIGVYACTATGQRLFAYHANEWSPMCGTFKAPLAAAILSRVENNAEQLHRMVALNREELVPASPVTAAELASGQISVERLVTAMLETGDSTAANLLLRSVGGPAGFTRWLREIGDRTTRLDRYEPELNEAALAGVRDSATPMTMAETVRRLLFERVLSPASRERIIDGMVANRTGLGMLRAGLPPEWRVGDQGGHGRDRASGNVAVVLPPGGEPVIVAAFVSDSPFPPPAREAAMTEIGRIIVDYFPGGSAPGAPKYVNP